MCLGNSTVVGMVERKNRAKKKTAEAGGQRS